MNPDNLHTFTDEVLRDAAFGLGFLAIILLLNTWLFIRVFLWFSNAASRLTKRDSFQLVARFMLAVLMMCVAQVGSILCWAAAIHMSGLIDDIRMAMLFVGSCYTTLGIFSDNLPNGWQSLAFYIAFSGLFSFAIATSAMMAMLGTMSKIIYSDEL